MKVGWGVAVIGIAAAVVAVFAEQIGLGDDPGFGRQQITMLIAGIMITGIGVFLAVRPPSPNNWRPATSDDLDPEHTARVAEVDASADPAS
jgi:hypothetical protein